MDVLEDIGRVQRELLLNNSLFPFVVYLNSHLNVGISFISGVSLSGYHATGLTLHLLEGHFLHPIFLISYFLVSSVYPCLIIYPSNYLKVSSNPPNLQGIIYMYLLCPQPSILTHGESPSSWRLHTFLFLLIRVFRVSSYPTSLSFLKLYCLYIPFHFSFFLFSFLLSLFHEPTQHKHWFQTSRHSGFVSSERILTTFTT